MMFSGTLCADLQIQVARLRIFGQAHPMAANAATSCEAGEALLTQALDDLSQVGPDRQWIYPELSQHLADALAAFPLREVYQGLGFRDADISILTATRDDEISRLRAMAMSTQPCLLPALLALVRYVLETFRTGARNDEPLYSRLSEAAAAESPPEFEQRCNEWAKASRAKLQSPTSMLADFFDACPELRPAQTIALDLMARCTHVIYVPLVVGTAGIAVPVEVKADYAVESDAPRFHLFADADLAFPGDQLGEGFANAASKARQNAAHLLTTWNLKPSIANFSVSLGLPDLDLGAAKLQFIQGSLEVPITLALFLQHPEVRRAVHLDPEVMATGPIAEPTLAAKIEARKAVGGASRLLVAIPGGRLQQRYSGGGLSVVDSRDPARALNAYVSESGRRMLYSRVSKIIVYGTYHRWDAPLQDAKPRNGQTRPLLPLEKHQQRLTERLESLHAIQLQGMPGIGKSCLVAQWLMREDIQSRYEVILFTSLLDFNNSDEGQAINKWAGPAIYELADLLQACRGLGSLRAGLMRRPEGDERYVLSLLRDCLGGMKVLWVIDNGEALLDEDGSVCEPRFRALFTGIAKRELEWDLVFVTNRRLEWPENLLDVVDLTDGFTQTEAREYLRQAQWPFRHLYDDVARVLSGHPRALALLVGLVKNRGLHQAEVSDLLERLVEGGEADVRQRMCEVILDAALDSVRHHSGQSAWWTLLQTSTFLQSFTLGEVNALLRAKPKDVPQGNSARDVQALDQRSLLNWDGERWWMHRLLRGYLQDRFQLEHPVEFKNSHRLVGESYFPLQQGHVHRTPRGSVLEKYSNPSGCAAAFYHFETAGYDAGQKAIIENVYEHAIPRVQWLMRFGRQPANPTYGYYGAERILRRIVEVYAGAEREDPAAGPRNVSSDINYLMAKALYRQKMAQKLNEALLHCREAVNKGREDAITLLVCILCDSDEFGSMNDNSWDEALRLFERVREKAKAGVLESSEFLGEAYEKIVRVGWIRRQLNPEEPLAASELISEAASIPIKWDRIYLFAADLAALNASRVEEQAWLERGLTHVPQSGPLWERLVLLTAENGTFNSIDERLRKLPRGVKSCISLCRSLLDKGLVQAARTCVEDGLRSYPKSAELLVCRGQVLEVMPHVHNYRKRAKAAYEKALELNPAVSKAYVALSKLEIALGNEDAAIRVLELGCKRCPTDGNIPLALGALHRWKGRVEAAEEAYRLGIHNAPTSGWLYPALASLQEASGNVSGAIATLKIGCSKAPRDGGCYFELAKRERNSVGIDDAIRTCEVGVINAPDSVPLRMLLAGLYHGAGRLDECADCYRHVIGIVPEWGPAYLALSRLQGADDRLEEALSTLRLARARTPWDASVGVALAEMHERFGEIDNAKAVYASCIERVPTWGASYIALARLQESQGDGAGALETLKSGCERAPADGNVPAALGRLYERMGDSKQAEEAYRLGIKQVPTWGAAYIGLAGLQESQGDAASAVETLKAACQHAPGDGDVPVALGQLYERVGDKKQAEVAG